MFIEQYGISVKETFIPAVNGKKKVVKHYLHGLLHNENGPAHIIYSINGYPLISHYYLYGKFYSKSIWEAKIGLLSSAP